MGANNSFGHPSPKVVKRLVNKLGKDKVYRTDVDGTVEFIIDGEGLWAKNRTLDPSLALLVSAGNGTLLNRSAGIGNGTTEREIFVF